VKAVVKALAKTPAGKTPSKRPAFKRRAVSKKAAAVAPRKSGPRSRKAPSPVAVTQAPPVTPVIEVVEADVTAPPTASSH
jgi:hypothetical protein